MGLTSAGVVEPPPHQTIWYTGSVKPGRAGISVIAGHVTYAGPDDFWLLDEVAVGAHLTIRYSDGTSQNLRVTDKASATKLALQKDPRVWGTSRTPVVALITCDRNSPVIGHHHTNNFVVWAVPTS